MPQDVDFHLPFPFEISADLKQARAHNLDWVRHRGLATEDQALTWYTSWDIRDIQPLAIRTFPDWKLQGDPKEIPFGSPRKLGFSFAKHGLSPGKYKLLLRVVHPLEASLAKRGGARPLPLRFANQTQRPSGWLVLGETTVKP